MLFLVLDMINYIACPNLCEIKLNILSSSETICNKEINVQKDFDLSNFMKVLFQFCYFLYAGLTTKKKQKDIRNNTNPLFIA